MRASPRCSRSAWTTACAPSSRTAWRNASPASPTSKRCAPSASSDGAIAAAMGASIDSTQGLRFPGGAAANAADDLVQRLDQLNAIGASLSAERDINRLLEAILTAAKTITRADGGTLYRVTEEKSLRFEIVRTSSLKYYLGGTTGNPVPFYPIQLYKDGKPNHSMVAAQAALTGKTINIADAYTAEGFDFTGTRAFDAKTGYRSKSFLTVPMRNHEGETIGVLQLI